MGNYKHIWNKWKNRKSLQRKRSYKKNQIQILELENKMTEIKSLKDRLPAEWREKEERISELEDSTIEFF